LKKAQESVNGVDRKDLSFMQNLPNPPAAIKMTCEAVVCLLKGRYAAVQWGEIKTELKKADFISKVLNFNTESLTGKLKD